MAGDAIRLDLGPLADEMRALGLPVGLMAPTVRDAKLYMVAQARRSIAESRSPAGVPYAPLKYRKGKPLYDKGLLIGSIQGQQGEDWAQASSNLKYARLHNRGGTVQVPALRPRRGKALILRGRDGSLRFARSTRAHTATIPARPFLAWSEAQERAVGRMLDGFVDRLIREL